MRQNRTGKLRYIMRLLVGKSPSLNTYLRKALSYVFKISKAIFLYIMPLNYKTIIYNMSFAIPTINTLTKLIIMEKHLYMLHAKSSDFQLFKT